MRIGFIGFGEAARAFTSSLGQTDASIVSTYDILFDKEGLDGATAHGARKRGVAPVESPAAVADASDWIFSAVTAASSFDVACALAPALSARHVFFDINSVSPDRKRRSRDQLSDSGSRYVDMAVMAPVVPCGHRTPVLLAGAGPEGIDAVLHDLGFVFERIGPKAGDATAIKMVRSLFVKGLEAVTVEVLLAARRSNCLGQVLESLRQSFPSIDWNQFPSNELERVTRHGVRRAAEMREAAMTLRELGCDENLSLAIAQTQERVGSLDLRTGSDLLADIDRVLTEISRADSGHSGS